MSKDLGLCYATFKTFKKCEMGHECPWRHHPLTSTEKAWILKIAGGKGEKFLDEVKKLWSLPDVPVPGGKF
jgi:hypothetical protein